MPASCGPPSVTTTTPESFGADLPASLVVCSPPEHAARKAMVRTESERAADRLKGRQGDVITTPAGSFVSPQVAVLRLRVNHLLPRCGKRALCQTFGQSRPVSAQAYR